MMLKTKLDLFIVIAVPVLVLLLFWNLGGQYLWYDEAQNAVLARSTLLYGYPRAQIGDFLVATDETYGVANSYIAQPWLQNYVCAVSFLLFGESAWGARVIFAVFGILSFYLLYALSNRLFRDRLISRLTLFIAATSVPYLLHLRQSRYYSLAVFLTLALLVSYLRFLGKERYGGAGFFLSSFFLFHANFGCLIPILASLFIHFFLIEKRRDASVRTLLALYAWIFLSLLPWAIIYRVWGHGTGENILSSILSNAKFYLSKINGYIFPYRFLFAAVFLFFAVRKFFLKRKINLSLKPADKKALIFLTLVIIINWAFLWFVDFNSVRYIIHIAGLFFIIEAFILKRVLIWNKFLGALFLFLLRFTNLLNTSIFAFALKPAVPVVSWARDWGADRGIINEGHNKKITKELGKLSSKARVRTYFFDYLYEITHDYDGPMEGVVKYLRANSKPGETIKTHSFNANPLFFYTDLKIDIDFSKETYPEWIFLRDYWTEDSFYNTGYFKKIEKNYKKIELDYPDIWWENRPDDLSHHYFRTAPLKKKISIYRRIS